MIGEVSERHKSISISVKDILIIIDILYINKTGDPQLTTMANNIIKIVFMPYHLVSETLKFAYLIFTHYTLKCLQEPNLYDSTQYRNVQK